MTQPTHQEKNTKSFNCTGRRRKLQSLRDSLMGAGEGSSAHRSLLRDHGVLILQVFEVAKPHQLASFFIPQAKCERFYASE